MMSKCQKQTNPMQKEKDLKLQTEMKIYKVVIPFKSAEKNLSSSKIDSKKSSTASKVAGFAAMGVGIATLDIDLINLSTEAFSDDSGNPYSRYTYKADIPKEWVAGHMEKKATKTDLGESPFQLKESEDYRRVHGREFYVVDTHPDAH